MSSWKFYIICIFNILQYIQNKNLKRNKIFRYDIVFNTLGHIADDFCANLVADNGILIDASSEYYVPRNANGFFYSVWLKLLQVKYYGHFSIQYIITKLICIYVSQKFGYRLWDTAIINSNALDELCELVNEGKLYPITDSVFKAKSCERAFWLLNSSKTVGKPVIYFKYVIINPRNFHICIEHKIVLPILTFSFLLFSSQGEFGFR